MPSYAFQTALTYIHHPYLDINVLKMLYDADVFRFLLSVSLPLTPSVTWIICAIKSLLRTEPVRSARVSIKGFSFTFNRCWKAEYKCGAPLTREAPLAHLLYIVVYPTSSPGLLSAGFIFCFTPLVSVL